MRKLSAEFFPERQMRVAPAKRKLGRPSSYTSEMADRVLAALPFADGGLEEICAQPGMPGARTVYRWLEENADFRQGYARAREIGGDVQAQRGLRDALKAKDAQLGRLRFDARKWTAAKLAPKKYSDRVTTEVTGPNGGPLQSMALDPERLKSMTDAELAALESAVGKLQRSDDGDPGRAAAPADEHAYSTAIDNSGKPGVAA